MNNKYNEALGGVNALILEKLKTYSPEVRELATRAVQLCETLPEATVADQLLALVRKLARTQEGDHK